MKAVRWSVVGSIVLSCVLPVWGVAEDAVQMEPMIVTATRTETPLRQVASSVTVITAEEIELKQARNLADALRGVPAIDIVQTGSLGGTTSVFIRGTESKHTLVLLDGVEIYDSTAPTRAVDITSLTLDGVERIEIIRGPQSVLYGSDAIGGVIQIFTRKERKGVQAFVALEAGSFATYRERAGVSGGADWGSLSLSVSRTDTNGFSAADEDNGNTEDDGYQNTTLALRSKITPTETTEINLSFRYVDDRSEFDNAGNPPTDAANINRSERYFTRGEVIYSPTELWTIQTGVAVSTQKRDTKDEVFGPSFFDGDFYMLDLQNTFAFGKHTLIVGAETEREEAETSFLTADAQTSAYYVQDQYISGDFSGTAGVRRDHHSEFGDEITWRLASSYLFSKSNTRLKATVGTGFETPSLSELFGAPFNNPDLDPERSLGWDLGVEQRLLNGDIVAEVTYFQNRVEDAIQFDPATFVPFNTGEIRTEGVEASLTFYPCQQADVVLSYTYTDTEDRGDSSRLVRRPLHKGGVALNLYPTDDWRFSVDMQYNGTRTDRLFPDTIVELEAYWLATLATSYQVTPIWRIFGRVENLFDEDYQEVFGFGTAGLSGYLGVEARL